MKVSDNWWNCSFDLLPIFLRVSRSHGTKYLCRQYQSVPNFPFPKIETIAPNAQLQIYCRKILQRRTNRPPTTVQWCDDDWWTRKRTQWNAPQGWVMQWEEKEEKNGVRPGAGHAVCRAEFVPRCALHFRSNAVCKWVEERGERVVRSYTPSMFTASDVRAHTLTHSTHKDIVCERKTISDFIVRETRWKEKQQISEK